MRRALRRLRIPALLFALLFAFVGCGDSPATSTTRPLASTGCPQAAAGKGSMGACAPRSLLPKITRPQTPAGITFPDRSNNNPTLNMAAVARHGHPAVYLKVNQGTGFVDAWFGPQLRSARAAGMAVGGYDFVSTYSASEANLFISLLHQAGMTRASARTLPPVLDVEFGAASRAGVQRMADMVRSAFGRVAIYTGAWYWTPHFGCWWPRGVQAWLSGYPTAPVPCGMPRPLFAVHQYTDRGFDGVGSVDMNLWLGSSAGWHSFSRTGPSKSVLERRLRGLVRWRAHLRRVLHRNHCRVLHRYETRPVNCVLTLKRGDASNRRIRSIRTQIKELS